MNFWGLPLSNTTPTSIALQTGQALHWFLAPADVAGLGSRWLAELQELDRCEYNNNHAQTRRHCSLEAQDPEGWGATMKATTWIEYSLILR